jgi:hypothetical protein
MDPTTCLSQIREGFSNLCLDNEDAAIVEVLELFESLDDWISRYGFPPQQWQREERS